MKRVLLALALSSNVMAEPLVTIPAYKDTTGFYAHVRCSGESLYEVCPTKIEVNCCVEAQAPKQIHLPRTEKMATQRHINPTLDYRYNYRIQ